MKPLLCVDFDGTIYDGKGLTDGCIEALALLRLTYEIAIFSARPTLAERVDMKRLLDQFRVPYDVVLDVKPNACYFIDDKGVRFTGDWKEVLRTIGG